MADTKLLNGAWQIASAIVDGERDPEWEGDFFWFDDARLFMGNDDAVWEYPCEYFPDEMPSSFSIWQPNPDFPQWHQNYIYSVDGDALTIIFGARGREFRPKEFESTAANGCTVYELRRSTKSLPD